MSTPIETNLSLPAAHFINLLNSGRHSGLSILQDKNPASLNPRRGNHGNREGDWRHLHRVNVQVHIAGVNTLRTHALSHAAGGYVEALVLEGNFKQIFLR